MSDSKLTRRAAVLRGLKLALASGAAAVGVGAMTRPAQACYCACSIAGCNCSYFYEGPDGAGAREPFKCQNEGCGHTYMQHW